MNVHENEKLSMMFSFESRRLTRVNYSQTSHFRQTLSHIHGYIIKEEGNWELEQRPCGILIHLVHWRMTESKISLLSPTHSFHSE